IGIVLEVALNGIFALDLAEIVKTRLRHGDALGAADERIAVKIDVAGARRLDVLGHGHSFDAEWVPPWNWSGFVIPEPRCFRSCKDNARPMHLFSKLLLPAAKRAMAG